MFESLKNLFKKEQWYTISTHTEYKPLYWTYGHEEGKLAGRLVFTYILMESDKGRRDLKIEKNWTGNSVVRSHCYEGNAKTTKYYHETVIPWLYNSLDKDF